VAVAGIADRIASERAIAIPRTVERTPLAIEKDRNGAAKGEAGTNRSGRTSSGGFKLRSSPLT